MASVWKATTPRSELAGELRRGEQISMRAWLEKAHWLLPNFESFVRPAGGNPGQPGPLNLAIQRTSEAAYQRAFFLQRATKVSGSLCGCFQIDWLDIEVPVVGGVDPRRPSLDMIGEVNGTPCVIAELKDVGGTSPFDAIQEVLSYGCSTRDNHLALTGHPGWTSDSERGDIPEYWSRYKGKYLVVGGPYRYWETWKSHWALIWAAGAKWLVESGLSGHRLIFVAFPEVDFSAQKGEKDRYAPRLENDDIWTVLSEAHASVEKG